MSISEKNNNLAVIRGAGDIASGIAVSLFKNGYQVIMTELPKPTVIRRAVSFAQAVFEKTATVEGVTAEFCTFSQIEDTLSRDRIAVVCDSSCSLLKEIKPFVLIDAVLAKRNIGTSIDMAPFVIGVGPGFTAGLDCDVVIETMRGYEPGKIIYKGSVVPNTGIPGLLGGYSTERVLYTENCGVFKSECKIGDIVNEGQIIAYVGDVPVKAKISGKVRGLLMDGLYCPEHFKIADIDSRGENVNHIRCSDKANAIASGVIKAISEFKNRG